MTPSTTNLSATISSGLLSFLSVFALGLAQAAPAPNTSPVLAPDWPQFHGPHRDSICTETGLLQEWPEQGPPLLWKCTGLGNGYATVAIANGRFFSTGDRKLAEETNRFQYVMAFDLSTQSNLWITRIGLPGQNGACSTPTVDGPLLYVISGDGNLVCVETGTGKKSDTRSCAASGRPGIA